MTISEWTMIHRDVDVTLDGNELVMTDMANGEIVIRRVLSWRSLPINQEDPMVFDDYICSILEQLYHEIKILRAEVPHELEGLV